MKIKNLRQHREVIYILSKAFHRAKSVLTDEKEIQRIHEVGCAVFNGINSSDASYIIPERHMNGFILQWVNSQVYKFTRY